MLVLRRLFCNWEESDMVEWKELGKLVKRNKGISITAGQMSVLNSLNGNVRVFAAGQTIADIHEDKLPSNCAYKRPSIIVKSRGYIDFEFYEKPFTHKNEMWSYSFDDKELGKFIYYYLTTKTDYFRKKAKANSVKLPQLCVSDTDNYLIPIPSKSEQERIVSILDTFTSSISNLKEQIKERRKQYEYYRDQLLDLEGKDGVEMKSLGEVCDVKNGYTPSTKNADFWEEGNIPWFTLEDIRKSGRILSDAVKHITPLGVKKNGLFPKDSIIVSTTATIGEHALILVDFMCNQQITCISINNKFKYNIGVKFLYYLGNTIGEWCRRNVNGGGGLSIVSTSKLKQYAIPIPSKEEQLRIVSILDQFEASIANLEAQLKEREKQYEYYRNQLLTFE